MRRPDPTIETIEKIRHLLSTRRFVPFYIETVDRKRYRISSSQHAAISPKPPRVIVWNDTGEIVIPAPDLDSVFQETKWQRDEANYHLAVKADALLKSGTPIALMAKQLKVPRKKLADMIAKLRVGGLCAFHKRRYPPPRRPIATPTAIQEARRREQILQMLSLLRKKAEAKGSWISMKRGSRLFCVPRSQLSKWIRAYSSEGFKGLLPRGKGYGPKHNRRMPGMALLEQLI